MVKKNTHTQLNEGRDLKCTFISSFRRGGALEQRSIHIQQMCSIILIKCIILHGGIEDS